MTQAGAAMPLPDPYAEPFARATPEARQRLQAIRAQVLALLPQAVPCFSYRMPAFRLGAGPQPQRVFFYFAAFKQHIGVYPPVMHDAALIRALAPHRGPKGNLSFAHDQPLPIDLIGRVAQALAHEHHLH